METRSSGIILIAGGALVAAGSFLAWRTSLGTAVSGIDDGNGWITLGAGAVAAATGLMTLGGRSYPAWLPWTTVGVAAVVAVVNVVDLLRMDLVEVGLGLWLVIGGVIVAVFALVGEGDSEP